MFDIYHIMQQSKLSLLTLKVQSMIISDTQPMKHISDATVLDAELVISMWSKYSFI